MTLTTASQNRILGLLLGTALGDSLGLPFEGLGPAAIARRQRGQGLRQRWWFGRGMISDDTEHACLTTLALLQAGGHVGKFQSCLRALLCRWLLCLPPGIGWATLRACVRMCLGYSNSRCGVASAGNGAAMRAAILGLVLPDTPTLIEFVRASTELTHTDARAHQGALLVALAAHFCALDLGGLAARLTVGHPELEAALDQTFAAVLAGDRPQAYLDRVGLKGGISGYIVESVPAAIYCWLRYRGQPVAIIEAALALGGDTDSVAAIAGALAGAELGPDTLPQSLLEGIVDAPFGLGFLRQLADGFRPHGSVPKIGWGLLALRNLGFLTVAVFQVAFRRFLGPWRGHSAT